MKIFGKNPDKKMAWIFAAVTTVVIIAIWAFIVRFQITEIKSDDQEQGLFQSFKSIIDEKGIDKNVDKVIELWNEREDLSTFENGFENKLEVEEIIDESEESIDKDIEEIEEKLKQHQNIIE